MKIFPVGCFILLSFLLLAFGQSAHCNDNYSVSPSNSPHNEPAANAEPATTDDQSGDQQSSGKGIIEKAGDKYKELLKKTDLLRCSVFFRTSTYHMYAFTPEKPLRLVGRNFCLALP
ncbi:MAG: hypothetical protein KAT62_11730 [Desulfuromonadales bacterium]|nr:hypothetical protein [Desulfuromonadales bacterium]